MTPEQAIEKASLMDIEEISKLDASTAIGVYQELIKIACNSQSAAEVETAESQLIPLCGRAIELLEQATARIAELEKLAGIPNSQSKGLME